VTRTTPHAQGAGALREDLPEEVKVALRLTVKGGRQPTRCTACGKRKPTSYHVWVPHTMLKVEGASGRCTVYGLCNRCRGVLTQEDIEALFTGTGSARG
jgi:hypothetical protein